MIVVGTSSSESVFPRLHAKLRQLGVDPPVVALVLPTGYAFNHDGTCLYFATVSVFLAQALSIDLSIGQQLGLLAILLITSKGGAGVAGSAIVVLASTLAATGTIPVAAVGLILGVHRLLSSAFVPVNVLGNAIATLVIARMERAHRCADVRSRASPSGRSRRGRGRASPSGRAAGAGRVVRWGSDVLRALFFEFRCLQSWEE